MFEGDFNHPAHAAPLTSSQHRILESVDYHLLVPLVEDEREHIGGEDDEHHHAEETNSLHKSEIYRSEQ